MQQCQVSELYTKWVGLNEGKEDICVVDVRSLEEYEQCHIDGVKHMPLHLLTVRHEEIGDDKPVYIICLSGVRSAQAAQWLTPQRKQPMINVAGGMSAWLQMGYPVAS